MPASWIPIRRLRTRYSRTPPYVSSYVNGAALNRARGKWEGDRASLERTKDALAAALAQIDEIEARTFE